MFAIPSPGWQTWHCYTYPPYSRSLASAPKNLEFGSAPPSATSAGFARPLWSWPMLTDQGLSTRSDKEHTNKLPEEQQLQRTKWLPVGQQMPRRARHEGSKDQQQATRDDPETLRPTVCQSENCNPWSLPENMGGSKVQPEIVPSILGSKSDI